MSFTAMYAGICRDCGERFEAGTQVENLGGPYVHAVCPGDRKPAEVCGTCFIEKPCSCDDERSAS